MIYVKKGKELESFITFVKRAIGVLSTEDYTSFLALFDDNRLTESDLILALKYLDETRPVLKVDNPTLIKGECPDVYFGQYRDESGYYMDYDLTTDGKSNDLTIQIEFLKKRTDMLLY